MLRRPIRPGRGGFTLMEVLLVLVILVILGSLVGVAIYQQQKRAFRNAAETQIGNFKRSLQLYAMDIRSFPATQQGLQSLVAPPADLKNPARWKKGYLDSDTVPLDPWDNPYQYELLDADTFRIWSMGPDGSSGTDDDISS